jgi:hypothetical protein
MVRLGLIALVVLVAAVPSAGAVTRENWTGIAVPKTAKPGKLFRIQASASFDPRSSRPPYAYLTAAVYRHRGEDACLKTVPVSRAGWTRVAQLAYTSAYADGYSIVYLDEKVSLPRTGPYRYCAYVFVTKYNPSISSRPQGYSVKAHDDGLIRVRR